MLNKITILAGIYCFCLFLFVVMVIETIPEVVTSITVFGIIFGIIGVPTFLSARSTKKKIPRYMQYIELVVNQNISDIKKIALEVGLPFEVVVNELQDMIYKGSVDKILKTNVLSYLGGYYIDKENKYIHNKNETKINEKINITKSVYSNAETVRLIKDTVKDTVKDTEDIVKCSGCGAKNIVKVGEVSECKYCGSPIKF